MIIATTIIPGALVFLKLTGLGPVNKRMILELFPPMAVIAIIPIRTPLLVIQYYTIPVPVWTQFRQDLILVRFPSKVLPIMGIHTETPIMVYMVYRAEGCLEVMCEEGFVVVVVVQ